MHRRISLLNDGLWLPANCVPLHAVLLIEDIRISVIAEEKELQENDPDSGTRSSHRRHHSRHPPHYQLIQETGTAFLFLCLIFFYAPAKHPIS